MSRLIFKTASEAKFVEVWLPLNIAKSLTYAYTGDQELKPGVRVIVPLKGKKLYTGFIWSVSDLEPRDYIAKNVVDVLDDLPYLDANRISFFTWLAQYYVCTIGEVLLAGVPAAHRVSSESFVQLHPDFDWQKEENSSEEFWLFSNLKKSKRLSFADISKVLGPGKTWLNRLRVLETERKVLIFDELSKPYVPASEYFLHFENDFNGEMGIEKAFTLLEEKPEEEDFLLKLISFSGIFESGQPFLIRKEDLEWKDQDRKNLAKLIKKGILVQTREKVDAFRNTNPQVFGDIFLSEDQEKVRIQIQEGFDQSLVVLLLGITGSGKTEIYIKLIQEALGRGKQCLFLLPEIAITLHIVSRLRAVFGDSLGVFHSRATQLERMEVWEGLKSGNLKLVVGVRSAVFLPFSNLGLIVVDEEHDSSYKQNEPNPRYQGRDAAVFLGHIHQANVLLGSATPSVESYYKAKSGKWHFVHLSRRFGEAQLPEIQFVDMKIAKKTLKIKLDISQAVLDGFTNAKTLNQQSILFQNRRGYAPFVQCKDCGWIAYCPNCDVSLTLHQIKKSLNCHYCGHSTEVPGHCQTCGSVQVESVGYGTEKLEESLGHLLPGFQIGRMDQDSTQSRKGFDQLLRKMAFGEVDVLVGTQMVTKGLDFENVTFVAVFDIDRILHYPDFRANERTFQLLSQIAGRAGRRKVKGKVLIQTTLPYHPLFRMVAEGETLLFYDQEVFHRKEFGFPPFARLIRITAKHKSAEMALNAATILTNELRKKLGEAQVLGPEAPSISRLRNLYIFHSLIKIPEGVSIGFFKEVVKTNLFWMSTLPEYKSVQWILDVDPN